jgi:transposase-like protein
MKRNKLIAGAATIAALAGGSAAAVAATTDHKAEETAVLTDAAKRLGVSTDQLRSALSAAEEARLAAAVKAGTLTQEQADAIKARGSVLDLGGGPGGGHGHGPGGGRELMSDAAKALGISESALFDQLRSGKTLSDIAKAHNTSLSEVQAAVKKAATARLGADLKAKRLTQAQYDEEVAELDEHIANLGQRGPGGDHGAPPAATPSPTATP